MRLVYALSLLTALAPVSAADLTVAVSGIRNAEGQIKLMLFDKAKGFRKEAASRMVLALPAVAGRVQATFPDLPPGRYAVIAYHDENGNGSLDLRFGMIPLEGHGLSNNPKVVGPPAFEQAALQLDEPGRRIEVGLGY